MCLSSSTHVAYITSIRAVHEISSTLQPFLEKHPEYQRALAIAQIPERVIQFRVLWENDKGEVQVNRGYRVQVRLMSTFRSVWCGSQSFLDRPTAREHHMLTFLDTSSFYHACSSYSARCWNLTFLSSFGRGDMLPFLDALYPHMFSRRRIINDPPLPNSHPSPHSLLPCVPLHVLSRHPSLPHALLLGTSSNSYLTVQLCYRPLQRRSSSSSLRQPLHPQVPRIRANIQECSHRPEHGWRQGSYPIFHFFASPPFVPAWVSWVHPSLSRQWRRFQLNLAIS